MGMIYKRGKVWWIKYYRNGKPFRESTKSAKETDAKRLLKKREGEISEGKFPGIYFDRVLFDELADDFLTDYRINGKKTAKRAEEIVRLHLRPFFGDMKVTSITTSKIKKYIEQRQGEGATNATINRDLAAFKRMFNLGAKSTPPKVARVPYIPMLAENNVRKGFFEHDQFLPLRDALPEYLKGFVTFAYKTGWRRSEIASLTWAQVDREQGVVRLEPGETKNEDGRTYYMDEEIKAVMKRQFGTRRLGCSYVFHREGMKIMAFRKSWATACKKSGLGKRYFHDFRRTAVRNMVRAGIPERVAMMISGHKTRSVFERYNIVDSEDLKQASVKMETYIQSRTGTITGTIPPPAQKKRPATTANPLKSLKPAMGVEPATC